MLLHHGVCGTDLEALQLHLQLFGVDLAVLPQLLFLGGLGFGVVQLSLQLRTNTTKLLLRRSDAYFLFKVHQ